MILATAGGSGQVQIRYSIESLVPEPTTLPRRQLVAGRFVIGRDPGCDLPLPVDGVSRRHAEIEILAGGGLVITDLGSTNGTRVDGRLVERTALRGDCVVQIGSCRLRLREHDPEQSGLVYATGQELPPITAPAEPAPADRTRAMSLRRDLQAAARATLGDPPPALMEALSRMLLAMLEPLQARVLVVTDASDRILAAAGELDRPRVTCAESGPLRLEIDPECALRGLAGELLGADLGWLRPASTTPVTPPESLPDSPGVPTAVPGFRRALAALQRVSASRVGILLLGETGVGKDLVARWVHRHSARASGPFVAINCAALPEDLLEAELFGVEEGAATGVRARPGVFEQADGGTLFLDELGDMSARTQARLLRVLEDGRVHRVGGTGLRTVDVRLVAATNVELEQAIAGGSFRSDLYHRLAGFEARIPPLRERAADIAPLVIHFFRESLEAGDLASPGITQGAMAALQAWPWPGNVRELRQVVAASVATLVSGEALDIAHLPERLRERGAEAPQSPASPGSGTTLAAILAGAERAALVEALASAGGEVEGARSRLGISKSSFYEKMKKHGLERAGS